MFKVNDGMNCWINWFIRSSCILINLVPRNYTALNSALGYLHKCTRRCVWTASPGPAHSSCCHFFTRCWYWPACWFSARMIPTHTNPQAELVLARLRAQQMISWLVQNEMSEKSILISAWLMLKNHISLSYATNTADHCVHLLKTLIPIQIRRIILNTVTIQNKWFFSSSISSRCVKTRDSLYRGCSSAPFDNPIHKTLQEKPSSMYRHASWKGIKNFFLACSVNDPLIAPTTLNATQVISETVLQFRVNCSSAWFKHR